jgi:proteasome lid subunit RPN8/RPN11
VTGESGGVLRLSASALLDAVTHATGSLEEVCGLFVKPARAGGPEPDSSVVRYRRCVNEAPLKKTGFKIGTDQLIEVMNDGLEIICIFHSHPGGQMRPSVTDYTSFPKHYCDHGLIYVGSGAVGAHGGETKGGGQLIHYDETGIYDIVYGVSEKGLEWHANA